MAKKRYYRHTVYDDAFRTLEQECPDALIHFVNKVFDKNYTRKAEVEHLRNEHYFQPGIKKRISDSHFRISTKNEYEDYHLECESGGYDDSIMLRIFEYSISHAVTDRGAVHDKLKLTFPRAGLVVLRNKGDVPDHMTFELCTPGGVISYNVPVILMSDYSLDDIFGQKMYFLLPFYFFNYEGEFSVYDSDEKRLYEFEKTYCDIIKRLKALDEADLSLRSKGVIIKQIELVTYRLAAKHKNITEKVDDIMGGKVLKMEWLERFDAAVAEGEEKGREEGRKEGIKEWMCRGLSLICPLEAPLRPVTLMETV